VNGLGCTNCTITPVLTMCPDRSLGGVFCNDTCFVLNRTCPTTQLPAPVLNNCTTCPDPVPKQSNFICADGITPGGPYCDFTSCTWQNRTCTPANFNRTGDCPVQDNVNCTGLVADQCDEDFDCAIGQKCCSSSCGRRCLTAVLGAPQSNSGFCPVVTVVLTLNGTCPQNCSSDANCTSNQKCCLNQCGGLICKSSVSTATCNLNACGPAPSGFPYFCPDGSSTGPFCQSVSGICKWAFRTCTNFTRLIHNDGTCPSSTGTINTNCSTQCFGDDMCAASQKCCFDGCPFARVCTSSVSQRCVATDFRGMRCLDANTAAQLFPNGLPSAPSDGIYFPEACYRCVQNAVCASNGTNCDWSSSFQQCIDTCSNPTVNVSLPCSSRSLCSCLNTPTTCSWCQYSQIFADSTGSNVTIPMGRCLQNSIADKCTGDLSSGGYMGNLIQVKPTDCTSTSINPNVINPTSLLSDPTTKQIISQVSNGTFTASEFQQALYQLGVKSLIIDDISPPSTNGNFGYILFTFDNLAGISNDQAMGYLNQALSNLFNLNSQQISTQILPSSGPRPLSQFSSFLAIASISGKFHNLFII